MATVDVDVSAKDLMEPKNKETIEGLHFEPHFCPVDIADPFDSVSWEKRNAEIKGENGDLLFGQKSRQSSITCCILTMDLHPWLQIFRPYGTASTLIASLVRRSFL